MTKEKILLVYAIFALVVIEPARAQSSTSTVASSNTSVNTSINNEQKLFQPDFSCTRSYIYHNRAHQVDSGRKQDGEGLRPLFTKNQQSLSLLNTYQNQAKKNYWPAWTASFGAGLLVGGNIYANSLSSPVGQSDTRLLFVSAGVFFIVSSLLYGQFAVKAREKTLQSAIDHYNDSAPQTEKIKVFLTPVVTGTGGEVKTLVPFPF